MNWNDRPPSPSRRAVLASISSVSLAGCSGLVDAPSSESPSPTTAENANTPDPIRWQRRLEETPLRLVTGPVLYVLAEASIHAFDHEDGENVWSQAFQRPIERFVPSAERLYVVTESRKSTDESPIGPGNWGITITALDAETGAEQWNTDFHTTHLHTATDARVVIAGASDTTQEVRLSMLDGPTGESLWERPIQKPTEAYLDSNTLYTLSDGSVHTLDSTTGDTRGVFNVGRYAAQSFVLGESTNAVIDKSDGQRKIRAFTHGGDHRWTFDDWFIPGMTLREGTIIASGNHIGALDADSGELLWKRSGGGSPAAYIPQELLITSQTVTAVTLRGGREQWTFNPVGESIGPVGTNENAVFVESSRRPDGPMYHLASVDPNDGSQRWHLEFEERLSYPVVDEHGAYLFGSADTLYAV